EFERDFFKFMNNSMFGKTMEDVRKYMSLKIYNINQKNAARKSIAHPSYDKRIIIDENIIIVHKRKKVVKVNKPLYLGMAILDISKLAMYDFHYNYIKRKYGEKAALLFTDTDSLTYE